MRPKLQSQNCFDVNYEQTVGLGAWLTKTIWKSNISLCLIQKEKSLSPNGGHLNLKFEMGVAGSICVIPVTITYMLQGTQCDMEIPYTFYWENICIV